MMPHVALLLASCLLLAGTAGASADPSVLQQALAASLPGKAVNASPAFPSRAASCWRRAVISVHWL